MKSFFIFFLCGLYYSPVFANSVTVIIINKSNQPIRGLSSKVENGSFFVNDAPVVSRQLISPGSTARFETGQAAIFCGTTGYVFYTAGFENKQYQLSVHFDVPYWGDNTFNYTCDKPFVLKHLSGGEGSDVTVTFEFTGAITPASVPPPPIDVPQSGNGWISGKINWSFETGMPKEILQKAFDIEVLAPTKFWPQAGVQSITSSGGRFSDYKALTQIRVEIEKQPLPEEPQNNNIAVVRTYPATVLKYTISNLPLNIPVQVKIKPKNPLWQTNSKTVAKPNNHPNCKWFVYTEEKHPDAYTYNYTIQGNWMNPDGTVAGNPNELNGNGLKKLKKFSIKTDVVLNPNDFNKSIPAGGKKINTSGAKTPAASRRVSSQVNQ